MSDFQYICRMCRQNINVKGRVDHKLFVSLMKVIKQIYMAACIK